MKIKRTIFAAAILLLVLPFAAVAQTSPDDPAIMEAKEKTAVVFDLGRFFGYLNTMEKETPELALSISQLEQIYEIMEELNTIDRVEADYAEKLLVSLEDDLLTPDQLMQVDQLAIAKAEARTTSASTGTGTGGGQITSYVAGGAFNPIKDPAKTIGQDFATFFEYVAKKLRN